VALRATLAAITFLGAFLLFQVQPIWSKVILPWFGGGPAVWTVCMIFFQTVLFAGYAWAHWTERKLRGPARIAVHSCLLLLALFLLPRAPEEGWRPPMSSSPTLSILLLLSNKVGVPFFIVSMTGPMVQSWFSRLYPDRSPYRLYALSNLGSLAALLTYPFAVEPIWGLTDQISVWTYGFCAYIGLSFWGPVWTRRVEAPPPDPDEGPAPTGRTKIPWILLPAFASAMLVSTTEQLGHDIAVVPFLWVLPLAAYLATFILAFDHPRWFQPAPTAAVTVVLIFGAALFHAYRPEFPMRVPAGIGLGLAALFGICMLCHGALAAMKPAPRHLTSYYLCIAFGGALGSLFVGVAAPVMFSSLVEWGAGMAAAYIAAWIVLAWICRGGLRAHLNVGAALFVVAVLGLTVILYCVASSRKRLDVSRNFFGVTAVEEGTKFRDLMNGRILHGRQFLAEAERRKPTTYYVEGSGIGRAMARVGSREGLRVGVVGLGAGCMAAHLHHPSQTIRFYEINPDVKRMAETWFTFLKDCPAKVEVVLGDARISLEQEPPQRYDVLAVDAFTGDSIPTHLLTLEALQLFVSHLAPDGVLVIHVSNRSVDLAPVVRGTAKRVGLRPIEILFDPPPEADASSSSWVICTRSEAVERELAAYGRGTAGAREIVWTDNFSTLVTILKLR
jgi:protein-L-isoaspartate O-methyltransferase